MANPQTVINPQYSPPGKKQHTTGVLNQVGRYVFHWPLFIICLLLSITAAWFYVQTLQPVYEVKATLLIKNEKKSADQPVNNHDIDLMNSTRIIENEIEILDSKQLVTQVVTDLALWVKYEKKTELVAYSDLYNSSPVKLNAIKLNPNEGNATLLIKIKDDQSFLMIMPGGTTKEFFFKNAFKSGFGTWQLTPTRTLSQFIGSTIKITVSDPDVVALGYQKSIVANLPNKLSTVIELSISDPIAQRGKDVLDKLIFNYNLADAMDRNEDAKKTIDSINQSIELLSGQVTKEEKGVEGFKTARGLTDLKVASQNSQQQKFDNETQLNAVKVQLAVINGIERYINSSQNSALPSTNGITDLTIIKSVDKLYKLQAQREELLATVPETNPDVKDLNDKIGETRTAIKQNVENLKASLTSQMRGLLAVNADIENQIRKIPTQDREYTSLTRNQVGKEAILSFLLQKKEEFRLSFASKIKNDRVVDPAYVGSVKNPKSTVYAAALLFGLLLPAGVIYARTKLSKRITNLAEIKEIVDIPVIVELPFDKDKGALADDVNYTVASERFRMLRTKLYYLDTSISKCRTTLVTSSIAQEGKSYVSQNLGIALARAGRKTIILEVDLRKPKIAAAFNLPKSHAGITDYVLGRVTQDEIIQDTKVKNLQIVSSGAAVNNPSELLEQKEMAALFANLSQIYDDIIIDSPPLNLVADGLILSRLCDTTLFVIRQGFTKKEDIEPLSDLYNQQQLVNVQLIFNGIHRVKYGYGYNYNNDYYNPKKSPGVFYSVFGDFSSRF